MQRKRHRAAATEESGGVSVERRNEPRAPRGAISPFVQNEFAQKLTHHRNCQTRSNASGLLRAAKVVDTRAGRRSRAW